MSKPPLAAELMRVAHDPDVDLAEAALVLARLESPDLEPAPYLARLDIMGETVRERLASSGSPDAPASRVAALNAYLFDEQRFRGNTTAYDDPRNSFLNDVMDRRVGIPITLAVVYIEVARRAGIGIAGINFPGHFLMRCDDGSDGGLILDPFDRGTRLSVEDCQELLRRHTDDAIRFDRRFLAPTTRPQILTRMLANLKRVYVQLRSFGQARWVTELLLALDPSGLVELRDRGLLAYHLNDFAAALRDLEAYLRLSAHGEVDDESRQEHEQIWTHVKTLRRRVASFN